MLLESPPDALVDASGHPHFGMWNAPLRDVNLADARVQTLPGLPGWLRLKQWQHVLVVHPEVVLSFAAVDAAYIQTAWVQVVDRATGAVFEHAHRAPGVKVRVARSLWDDHTSARARGFEVALHNHLDAGVHQVRIEAGKGARHVKGAFTLLHDLDAIQPLVVSLPVGRGRAMYSHKVPLPVQGQVTIGGRTFPFTPANTTAVLDIHKAHYPRRTWWKWSTFAGHDAQGRSIAVNLTRNVVTDDGLHENAVWVDGTPHLLGPAQFELDRTPWSMGAEHTDLWFTTQGERREDMNYGLVMSRFSQRFGVYNGHVQTPDGRIDIPGWFGLAEDHHARW